MKRILSFVLVLVMVLSIVAISGCGKKTTEKEAPVSGATEAPAETPKTDEVKEPVKEEVKEEAKEEVKEETPVKETPAQSTPAKAPASKPAAAPVTTPEVKVESTPVVTPAVTPVVTPAPAPAPEVAPAPAPTEKPAEVKPAEPEPVLTTDGYLGKYPIIQDTDTLRMVEDMIEMSDGVRLYTRYLYPKTNGEIPEKMPIVFERTPYDHDQKGKHHPIKNYVNNGIVKGGFLYIWQNDRGTANSEGSHPPYDIREALDGYETIEHIRTLPQYDGEIYLKGQSYHATDHFMYLDLPGADLSDIKGAVFQIQEDRLVTNWFRNGTPYGYSLVRFMFEELMYRDYPNFPTKEKYQIVTKRPYINAVKTFAEGQDRPDIEEWFKHPTDDEFWQSRPGYNAAENITFPVLFMEGWYDHYCNGMFSIWERLPEETRAKSAFMVGPWAHGTTIKKTWDYQAENGGYSQYFGSGNIFVAWFNSIRNGETLPYASLGKITYHPMGSSGWRVGDAPWEFDNGTKKFYFNDNLQLTEESATEELTYTYEYDPDKYAVAYSTSPMKAPDVEGVPEIRRFTTPKFEEDTEFFGELKIKLDVSTDCEDTAFFARFYFVEPSGEAYFLNVAPATLSYFYPEYKPGEKVTLEFSTPEIAFLIKKGGAVMVDISSYHRTTEGMGFAPNPNVRGNWWEITDDQVKIANNTLHYKDSYIELPIAKNEVIYGKDGK